MLTVSILFNELRRIWIQPLVWIILGITFIIIALLFLVLLNNFYLDIQVEFAGLDNAPGVTDSVLYPMIFCLLKVSSSCVGPCSIKSANTFCDTSIASVT